MFPCECSMISRETPSLELVLFTTFPCASVGICGTLGTLGKGSTSKLHLQQLSRKRKELAQGSLRSLIFLPNLLSVWRILVSQMQMLRAHGHLDFKATQLIPELPPGGHSNHPCCTYLLTQFLFLPKTTLPICPLASRDARPYKICLLLSSPCTISSKVFTICRMWLSQNRSQPHPKNLAPMSPSI